MILFQNTAPFESFPFFSNSMLDLDGNLSQRSPMQVEKAFRKQQKNSFYQSVFFRFQLTAMQARQQTSRSIESTIINALPSTPPSRDSPRTSCYEAIDALEVSVEDDIQLNLEQEIDKMEKAGKNGKNNGLHKNGKNDREQNITKMRYLALYRRYRKKKRVYVKSAWFYRTIEIFTFTLPILLIQLLAAVGPLVFEDFEEPKNLSKKISTGLAACTAIIIAADNWVCLLNFRGFFNNKKIVVLSCFFIQFSFLAV